MCVLPTGSGRICLASEGLKIGYLGFVIWVGWRLFVIVAIVFFLLYYIWGGIINMVFDNCFSFFVFCLLFEFSVDFCYCSSLSFMLF